MKKSLGSTAQVTDCWPHFHLSDRDEMSSDQFSGDILIAHAVVGYLDQDYCYNSVASQIPQDFRLALFRPARDRTRTTAGEADTLLLRHIGEKFQL